MSKYRVAVLTDADPETTGKLQYADTLDLYDSNGKSLWQLANFNVAQWGGSHLVASAADGSIYVSEPGRKRLSKYHPDSSLDWEQKDISAREIVVDPKTGDLWTVALDSGARANILAIYNASGGKLRQSKF